MTRVKKNRTRPGYHRAHQKQFSGYRFHDRDPRMDEICHVIENSGFSVYEIKAGTGVSESTIRNWLYGKTKNPARKTVEFVLIFCGVPEEAFRYGAFAKGSRAKKPKLRVVK